MIRPPLTPPEGEDCFAQPFLFKDVIERLNTENVENRYDVEVVETKVY
jgi:hypothetical protein